MTKFQKLAKAHLLLQNAKEMRIAADYVRHFPNNDAEVKSFERQARDARFEAIRLMAEV